MTGSRNPSRYALIDALRAIACLAVVLYHAKEGGHIAALQNAMPAALLNVFTYGYSGVSVFFVISGFVIAHSMFRDPVDGRYSALFMLRRSLRLDPPYWAAIALAIAAAYVSAKIVPGKIFTPPTFGNLLLHVTYLVDLAGQPKINSVYWTLCLEMQFYISFVLLMWVATIWGRRIGDYNARKSILLLSALVAALWITPWKPFDIPGLFLAHWHLFVMGALLRYALDDARPRQQRAWCVAAVLALAAACLIWQPTVSELLGVATGLLLLTGAWQARLLNWSGGRVLQWLGLVSYSLYLTHNTITGIIFRIGYRITGRTAATEALWLVVVTIACCLFAWAFYFIFERAGLRLSKMISLRPQRQAPPPEQPAPIAQADIGHAGDLRA